MPLNKGNFVRWVLLFLAIFALVSACFFWFLERSGTHISPPGPLIHAKFRAIGIATQLIIADENKNPPEDIDAFVQWLKAHSEYLSTPIWEPLFKKSEEGALLDPWGNKIVLSVNSSKEYSLCSFGPNGKFEDGKGDDVVYLFNPFELAQEKGKDVNKTN